MFVMSGSFVCFVYLYVCNVVLLRVFRVFCGSAFIKQTTNRTNPHEKEHETRNVLNSAITSLLRGSAFIKRTTNHTKNTKKNTKQKGLKFSDNFVACMFESVRRSCSCEFVVPGSWRKRTDTTNSHESHEQKKKHETERFPTCCRDLVRTMVLSFKNQTTNHT